MTAPVIFALDVATPDGNNDVQLFRTRDGALGELQSYANEQELGEDEDTPTIETVEAFLKDRGWDIDIHEIELPSWLAIYPVNATDADKRAIDASRGGLRL